MTAYATAGRSSRTCRVHDQVSGVSVTRILLSRLAGWLLRLLFAVGDAFGLPAPDVVIRCLFFTLRIPATHGDLTSGIFTMNETKQ